MFAVLMLSTLFMVITMVLFVKATLDMQQTTSHLKRTTREIRYAADDVRELRTVIENINACLSGMLGE
jgi:CHASE3 domain sensor protein